MTAVLAVEKHAIVGDKNGQTRVFLVPPIVGTFRTSGFLVAVSGIAENNPEAAENFIRRQHQRFPALVAGL